MVSKLYLLTVYAFLICVSSCDNSESRCGSERVLVNWDSKIPKISEVIHCEDSLVKTLIEYNSNGKVRSKCTLRGNLKDGSFVKFYPNSKVEYSGNFVSDSLNGEWRYYYPNGKIELIENWNMGRRVKDFIRYYENGQVKKYLYIDYEPNTLLYERQYSVEGKVIKSEGVYVGSAVVKKNRVAVGDTFSIDFYVATPPRDTVFFSTMLKNGDKNNPWNNVKINNGIAQFRQKALKRGSYTLVFKVEVNSYYKKDTINGYNIPLTVI